MKTTDDIDAYTGIDHDECPWCKSALVGLADDVGDGDYRDEERDVAVTECPSCQKWVAVVREHSFYLAKVREPRATTPQDLNSTQPKGQP